MRLPLGTEILVEAICESSFYCDNTSAGEYHFGICPLAYQCWRHSPAQQWANIGSKISPPTSTQAAQTTMQGPSPEHPRPGTCTQLCSDPSPSPPPPPEVCRQSVRDPPHPPVGWQQVCTPPTWAAQPTMQGVYPTIQQAHSHCTRHGLVANWAGGQTHLSPTHNSWSCPTEGCMQHTFGAP